MKKDTLLDHLEELTESLGYTIRKENGAFQGNHCILEGDKVVLLNKKKPIDMQIGVLARLLQNKLENTYIKPAVRKELNNLWQRFERA